MRYDLTVANNSNVPLENFYLHDRFPTDCATAKTITTGTYNTRLNYQITYKTNYNDYRVLATNLMGEFYGCKFATPHLRKTKGSIINMSSILSKVGQEQTAGYSSTKGGINSMTQTIAIEEARHGVRVNAICPGHIMTEIVYKEMERVADPEAYLDRCNHYSWLGRGGQPEEVGTAALFLASSWAGYITGVTLNVSGGMEFGTIPKYYAFDASAEKMKNNTQEEN